MGVCPEKKSGRLLPYIFSSLCPRNVLDRIQPVPGEDPPNQQSTAVKLRLGKSNSEKREAQRKSRRTRDMASSRQRFPREAKGSQNPKSKCNQIEGYIFHTRLARKKQWILRRKPISPPNPKNKNTIFIYHALLASAIGTC